MEYYPALKRGEILIHPTTRMNLDDTMLIEITQTQKNVWGSRVAVAMETEYSGGYEEVGKEVMGNYWVFVFVS